MSKDQLYARILIVDSTDELANIIEDDYSIKEQTPYPYKAVHVPNSFSHNTTRVLKLVRESWWDAILFLGVKDQSETFERILHEQGRNRLGLPISVVPKFAATAYSHDYLTATFKDYSGPQQRVYHVANITFWQRWRSLAKAGGLLEFRCPYGYAIDPGLDGTAAAAPVEFVRSFDAPTGLRGPNLCILPRRVFAEVEVIKEFLRLLSEGPNAEVRLHKFLDAHPQLLYGSDYDAHFSEVYQRYLLEDSQKRQKAQRLDFLLVPKRDLPATRPKIVELKRDIPRILEKSDHAGFVHKVLKAVNQVRDYKRLYQEERHRRDVQTRTGVDMSAVQLAVLVGRFPDKTDLPVYLDRKSEIMDVEIITYDELVMHRRAMLAITAPDIDRFF